MKMKMNVKEKGQIKEMIDKRNLVEKAYKKYPKDKDYSKRKKFYFLELSKFM